VTTSSLRALAALACAVVASTCAHDRLAFNPARRPTVLVLSVGGPDGVVHLGAIAAVKEARLNVAGVVGNSMGALVGALYASAPGEDTAARLQGLVSAYAEATIALRLAG
jgi:NTE family protein